MSRVPFGTVCSVVFGVTDVALRFPMSSPDKKTAITAVLHRAVWDWLRRPGGPTTLASLGGPLMLRVIA